MMTLSVFTPCATIVARPKIVTRAAFLAMSLAPALPAVAPAQDIPAHKRQTEETIQAACHGFMVDALPEALSWLKESIYENSPFCQRAAAAGDLEEFGEAVEAEYSALGPNDTRIDLSKRVDRDLQVTVECRGAYMCMETRLRFQGTDTPVSQDTYDTVRDYCDGRYGCIESYFQDWPVPLPTPGQISGTQIFRFEDVVSAPGTPASPTPQTQTAEAVASKPVENTTEAPPAPVTQTVPDTQEPQADEQQAAAQPALSANPEPIQKIGQLAWETRLLCQCSLSGTACYDNPYGPVRESISRVEAQRRQYCQAIDGVSDTASLDQGEAEAALDQLTLLRNGVLDANRRAQAIIDLAAEDFERVQVRAQNNLPFVPTLEVDKIAALSEDPADLPGGAPAKAAPSGSTATQAPAATTTTAAATTTDAAPGVVMGVVMGPRQGWQQATTYCANQGMRLPTVAEARALIPQLPDEDWWFGLWTSEPAYVDAYVQRYETMRQNGMTEGENKSWEARVACVQ